jgi:hypothetical protein
MLTHAVALDINSSLILALSTLYQNCTARNMEFFCSACTSIWGSGITVPFIVFLGTRLKLAVSFTLRPYDHVEGGSENEKRELLRNTGPPILLVVTLCEFVSFSGISAVRLFLRSA